jgi:hypothetical protein
MILLQKFTICIALKGSLRPVKTSEGLLWAFRELAHVSESKGLYIFVASKIVDDEFLSMFYLRNCFIA